MRGGGLPRRNRSQLAADGQHRCAAAAMEDRHFPRSPADRQRLPARCLPILDRRCCPWSVLHFHAVSNGAGGDGGAGGELTAAAAPEELRAEPGHPCVGQRHGRGGHTTAGGKAGRRRWTAAGVGDSSLRVVFVRRPTIGCREVVAAIGRRDNNSRPQRRDKRLAPIGA